MSSRIRILDFRNRPPLPAFAQLFEIKRSLLLPPVKRFLTELWLRWLTRSLAPYQNRGAATASPSMNRVGRDDALSTWWHEIDAAGISAVCANGRLSEDRGSIDAASLADLEKRYPGRFYGLAPANLEIEPAKTVADCEHAIRVLGLRGINIEPCIRKRGGPASVDHPDLYPLYESMSALNVPVMAYTGPFAGKPIELSNDMAPYDRVLRRFPKLVMVIGHGGYPKIRDVLDLMRRNPRFHVCPDIYAFWPRGAEYLRALDSVQDQLVFGTAYPFSTMAEPIEDTLKLNVKPRVLEKYMWSNGARLLKI